MKRNKKVTLIVAVATLVSSVSIAGYNRSRQDALTAANPLFEENLEALADSELNPSNVVSPYVLTPVTCNGNAAHFCTSTSDGSTCYLTNQVDCDGDRWSPNNPNFDSTYVED